MNFINAIFSEKLFQPICNIKSKINDLNSHLSKTICICYWTQYIQFDFLFLYEFDEKKFNTYINCFNDIIDGLKII
jgi:hypothetical protein